MHLQLLRLHNAYQFKVLLHLQPFEHNFKVEFWDPQFWGLWSVRGSGFEPIESQPTTSQYISIQRFALCRRLAGISMSNTPPLLQFDPVWGGLRASKMVPIKMSAPHSNSTSLHTIGLSCTVSPQYTTWQATRQSNRNRLPCYSIDGLIKGNMLKLYILFLLNVMIFNTWPNLEKIWNIWKRPNLAWKV